MPCQLAGTYNCRMQSHYKVYLVVFGLLALIVAPVVSNGYYELSLAEQLAVNSPKLASLHYERAALRLPWRADLWTQAGLSAYRSGNYDDAIRLFTSAQKRDALSAAAWNLFGAAYWAKAEHAQALNIWQTGAQKNPAYAPLYDSLALAYHENGDYASEQDTLTMRLSLQDDARAHYRLALLLTLTDSTRALREFTAASSLDPEFDSVSRTMVTALNISALQTDETTRLITLGRGLGLVNEWGLAFRAFEQAVGANGENAEAWAWLGEAKQHNGQDGRAELDQALALDKQSVIVRALRGLYWKRQKQYKEALNEYRSASELEPENPAWQVSIGEAYLQLGDLASALASYQRAAELAPNDATYWRLLAVFCAANNVQVEEVGLPAAQRAQALAPDDPLVLDALGWSYLSSGRYTLAEQTLQKALQHAPDLASAHLHLGMTRLAQNERASAYVELSRARDLDPQSAEGQFAAELLKQYFH